MKLRMLLRLCVCCLVLVLASGSVFGQEFSLDDDPFALGIGLFRSAEDEYGLMLPPTGIPGMVGPSPTLTLFGFQDSDILFPGPGLSFPIPPLRFVDSVCADHSPMTPVTNPWIWLRFSIDRATGGIPGSASNGQAVNNDQPGDVYDTMLSFRHPGMVTFPAAPMAWPFGGVLNTAWPMRIGTNLLFIDNMGFGLLAAPLPFVSDNVDAYNDFNGPVQAVNHFYTLAPADAAFIGFSPADIMGAVAGQVGFVPPPYAWAPMLGLDAFPGAIPGQDSIDALIVWDYGQPSICDPSVGPNPTQRFDYALFSLAPGSQSLTWVNNALVANGFPQVDPAAIFVTDFSGVFYLYAYSNALGLAPSTLLPGMLPVINVDALEAF